MVKFNSEGLFVTAEGNSVVSVLAWLYKHSKPTEETDEFFWKDMMREILETAIEIQKEDVDYAF